MNEYFKPPICEYCGEPLWTVWYKRVIYNWNSKTGTYEERSSYNKMRYFPEHIGDESQCHCKLTEGMEVWFYNILKASGLKPKGRGRWKRLGDWHNKEIKESGDVQ
jgi:hypothetical protein